VGGSVRVLFFLAVLGGKGEDGVSGTTTMLQKWPVREVQVLQSMFVMKNMMALSFVISLFMENRTSMLATQGAVSDSTDSSAHQSLADRCFFRCVHLAAASTIHEGGIFCTILKMVISPTHGMLVKFMYLRLSMVLWVSLHRSKKVFGPIVCCSAHSKGVVLVRDVFWAGSDDARLDVAKWYQHMEAISNLQKYGFQPRVFVVQDLEHQRWNIILRVSLWSRANITSCSRTGQIHEQQRSWTCLYDFRTIKSGKVRSRFFMFSARTMFYLSDDHLVEDVVLPPFGMCHQSCTTTPLLMIPRFNGGDTWRLSSVMVPQNPQLNPSQPQVHTSDRPSGEPPVEHQLVWSTLETLEDCRCSNIKSVLSTDE
jgi:hypothetical protein